MKMKKNNVCCPDSKPLNVNFCPKCKASELKKVYNLKNLFGLLPRIECEKCGHVGEPYPIVLSNKQNKKRK